jgi:integrase/recombinase XerC
MPRIHTSDLLAEDQQAIRRHLASLKRINRSEKTIRDREGTLRRLAWWLRETHQKSLDQATGEDLAAWQDSHLQLAAESRRAYTCHAKSFYDWRAQVSGDNPAELLIVPAVPKRQPRPMDENSVRLCLVAIREPERTWIALANFQGMRAKEIANLAAEDLTADVDPKLVHIHGKGAKERVQPIDDTLFDMVASHVMGTGPIWKGPGGRRLTGKDVSERCSNALHGLGLPYTLHNGRHRAGTQMFRLTKNIRLVQELLGHESVATTAIYTAVANSETAAALKTLAKQLQKMKEVPM